MARLWPRPFGREESARGRGHKGPSHKGGVVRKRGRDLKGPGQKRGVVWKRGGVGKD